MLKKLVLLSAFLPLCSAAFRLDVKNKADIPHGKELEIQYVNGFARKFPHCIVHLLKENRHDQRYRAIKYHLEAIITNGIRHHKDNSLMLAQDSKEIEQEIELVIKNNNLESSLQKIEEDIRTSSPIHPAHYTEVPSVFIQNN